jgi:glycerophosphoryl diester phosphodiesterase
MNNPRFMRRSSFLKLMLGSAGALGTGQAFFNVIAAEPEKKTDPFHSGRKFVVAHRGASAYAPENTLPAYELAIKQGADYVEQDLHISRDGVLMCCHDFTLERVTNVSEVFPDRFKEETVKGKQVKKWYLHEFTAKEIQQLDAGSYKGAQFKGTVIPTWQQAIDTIRGKAGLCPETKGPEFYGKLGFDMEALVMEVLKRNGLENPSAKNSSTPVYIQSFSKPSLVKLHEKYDVKWPILWLANLHGKWTPETLDDAKTFADSIGPAKKDVTAELVKAANSRGLKVFPYTFYEGDEKPFPSVAAEMSHYLYDLGVDGMFTNNPDKFPRKKISES